MFSSIIKDQTKAKELLNALKNELDIKNEEDIGLLDRYDRAINYY